MPALILRPFLAVGVSPTGRRPARTAAPLGWSARAGASAGAPLDPGEARRFRDLMLPHLDAAYGFARFLARDPTLAEDLAQDAYLTAYRAFGGYRGGDAKAWLFTIVRSTFLSHTRRGRAWTDLDEADEVPDPGDTPEGLLLRKTDDQSVRAAVDALPDPFREAIVLRELEEMSYRDIAEITGVPIGTVMSRLARARRLLAQSLALEGLP